MTNRKPAEPIQKTSEDGHQYLALKTPGTLSLANIHYSAAIDSGDGFVFHHFFIPCETLRKTGLPLDANPREPSQAKVVNEMASTLRESPGKFHHWNNGITIVSDEFTTDPANHTATLRFEVGSGICNGGHTYFAIVTYPNALSGQAFVHLEVIDIPDELTGDDRKHVINDIARNRNANRQLLPTTQADYLGYYAPFQRALGADKSSVIWHEGDSEAADDAIKSELLIRMLACLDPLWYSHPIHSPNKGNHKNAATGSSSIHMKWFDGQTDPETNLNHMAPLSIDAFVILEIISHSLKHDNFSRVSSNWRRTNFYQSWLHENEREVTLRHYRPGDTGVLLPNPAKVMFLGCFRSNVWLGKNDQGDPAYIGFLVDNKELWENGKFDLLRRLTSSFDDSDQDPNQFIKSNAPYENQLLSFVYGQRPPLYPIYFYRLSDQVFFQHDTEHPTHILIYDEEGYADLKDYTAGDDCEQEDQLFRVTQ